MNILILIVITACISFLLFVIGCLIYDSLSSVQEKAFLEEKRRRHLGIICSILELHNIWYKKHKEHLLTKENILEIAESIKKLENKEKV